MPDHNIAIIGYGLAGRVFHAPLITATEGLRVTAIVTSGR
jgi:predicted dehydrogenase